MPPAFQPENDCNRQADYDYGCRKTSVMKQLLQLGLIRGDLCSLPCDRLADPLNKDT